MEKDKEKIEEVNVEEGLNESNEPQNADVSKDGKEDQIQLEKNEESIGSEDEVANETEEDLLREEIRMLKEEKIRVLAEMENLRKRFEREKIDSIKLKQKKVKI